MKNLLDTLEGSKIAVGAVADAILSTAADAIVVIDSCGIIVKANRSAERMFQYGRGELTGQQVTELMPAPHREQHQDYIDSYLRTGEAQIIGIGREVQGRLKDGTLLAMELSVSEVRLEDCTLFTGILRDVSARRQAEEELARALRRLKESRSDLLSVLNRLRMGTVVVDRRRCVVYVSEACRPFLCMAPADVVGLTWREAFRFSSRDSARLEDNCVRPEPERERLQAQFAGDNNEAIAVEVEILDDPRDPNQHFFFIYDISETVQLRNSLRQHRFQGIVGQSKVMQGLFEQIERTASGDWTILIEGETGAGKELVARAIHESSPRHQRTFMAVNLAGLSESLIQSQLFGHRKGAFTGATSDREGLFEAAAGGTLLIDEIGDAPVGVQVQLLRVLQEREIVRLGETHPRKIDVRILAATHRDLAVEVAAGRFREDLLYRVRIARLRVPPLRERHEDIPLLAEHFLQRAASGVGRGAPVLSPQALSALMAHDWPGNVRELRAALESAMIHCQGERIERRDLPPEVIVDKVGGEVPPQFSGGPSMSYGPGPSETNQAMSERDALLRALEQTGGQRGEAARLLNMSRATLYRRLDEFGIPRKNRRRLDVH